MVGIERVESKWLPSNNVEIEEHFRGYASEKVKAAFLLAEGVHEGQFRGTGERYITHCVAVATILEQWGADEDVVVAGLLHDTVEDHPQDISLGDVESMFGARVADMVDGATKFRSVDTGEFGSDLETLKKVTRETLMEPGVALIKLADRLHNMSTMEGVPERKRKPKADETLRVYVPLAESLGLWEVKKVLQDLSFKYAEPDKWSVVKEQIDGDPRLNQDFIEERKAELQYILDDWGLKATIEVKVGGYKEMESKRRSSAMEAEGSPKSFEDITDILSMRIIVGSEDVKECYLVKAALEQYYGRRIDARRDDDFICEPSVNGYSAIHKSVEFDDVGWVEMAITTRGRENFNDWGILSMTAEERRVRRDEYVRKLIFTPKGDLIFLPLIARGIDVAYSLDAWIGLKAKAMLVDGKATGLDVVVPNASVVEFVLDYGRRVPEEKWLEYCSPVTRRIIEKQIKNGEVQEMIDLGKERLLPYLEERGLLDFEDLNRELQMAILEKLGCRQSVSRLYFKMGYGGLEEERIKRVFDDAGVTVGLHTSIEVKGRNRIGVSKEIASIIAKYKGDVLSSMEKVNGDSFVTRKLIRGLGFREKVLLQKELNDHFGIIKLV